MASPPMVAARCAQYAAGAGADGTSWRALCHADRGFEHTDGERGGRIRRA